MNNENEMEFEEFVEQQNDESICDSEVLVNPEDKADNKKRKR